MDVEVEAPENNSQVRYINNPLIDAHVDKF